MKTSYVAVLALAFTGFSSQAMAWGADGHRAVAAIAIKLLPPDKAQAAENLLSNSDVDRGFVDAASYADEVIRERDHRGVFSPWHFVRQSVGVHDRAVIAPKRVAMDQKIATAVTPDVTESDRRKSLALTQSHHVQVSPRVIGVATFNPFATFFRCVGTALRASAHSTLALHPQVVRCRTDYRWPASMCHRPVFSPRLWRCQTRLQSRLRRGLPSTPILQ